ncbi:hypothetical protein [Loigolactobacillus zhaoyuanensis]|uniref:Uncharacterized protein n=1 Tax=Loigolactobacillus zhaoyuanensis TaxID=2486017 RepID=A0ABW8UHR7_9LACO|nr:hypothetical protein [Loigolactobacillus zhaoyuanensis]
MRKIHLRNRAKNRKISETGSHDFKDMVRQAQQSSHDFQRLQDKFAKLIVNYRKKS